MAQGPQVRSCADWLQRELSGRRIEACESPRGELAFLAGTLAGRIVVRAFSRGEHLLVELDDGRLLHNQLRTEGKWRRLRAPDEAAPADAWLTLRLGDRAVCNLHGQTLELLDTAGSSQLVAGLGIDVLDRPYPAERVARCLGASSGPIAEALLDQRLVCGIGDTARSEALFRAGIHPRRAGRELSEVELRAMAESLRSVTSESCERGGGPTRSVHQRAGEPCPRCGATIELLRRGRPQRDTFFCPRCQPPGPALLYDTAVRAAPAGTFRLGLAVWSFAGWTGSFFPPGARARDYLRLYAERMTAVEGNTTFYGVPSARTLERWRDETPPGFRFCPKLPREVTHRSRLAEGAGEALAFLAHMRALGDRLGPVLAQLPPTLGPRRADDLAGFLDAWPHEKNRLSVEVRHPDWLEETALERLDTLLAERGAGRAILDARAIHEEGPGALPRELRKKPELPVSPTAPGRVALVRFIAHPDRERSRRWMRTWLEPLGRWLREGREVLVFVHCPREEHAPQLARDFQGLLEEAGAPVPPLPWNLLEPGETAPRQLQLF